MPRAITAAGVFEQDLGETYMYLGAYARLRIVMAIGLALGNSVDSFAADAEALDAVSVTATRVERETKNIPSAVSVIDEEQMEKTRMFNITDALKEAPGVLINSSNGGYDARLIIRGAGLKANYGIREVMLLRDGVPITDPDSFTRLDFLDTQDIERIEVSKGPGNLYAAGSSGGTVQIVSKSVFDMKSNTLKFAMGDNDLSNLHARFARDISDDQAIALTFSHRQLDNDWRRDWNEYDTTQLSLKHGMFFGDDNVWESEISYTEANLQLPGAMNDAQYNEFKRTGEQTDNENAWKHSGRYSDVWFFNTRMEMPFEGFTFKPKFYYNTYKQYHPVTATIVDTPGVEIFGIDLEAVKPHQLFGMDGTLAGGVTYRKDMNHDAERYEYADVLTTPPPAFPPGRPGRIIATLSDRKGTLLEVGDTDNTLYGFFIQESLNLGEHTVLDIGGRVDRSEFEEDTNEMRKYDWALGNYVDSNTRIRIDEEFSLFSGQIGISHELTDSISTFASLAQADQVPYSAELSDNPDLDKSTASNFEIGLKGRAKNWSFDTSVYWSEVDDEVIASRQGGETIFQNAGTTDKRGFELAGSVRVMEGLNVGLNYAYSDYEYDSFSEVVNTTPGRRPTYENKDRSGNSLPYIPENKHTLFADYKHPSGWTARVSLDSWGSYYLDSANSEKYEGYDNLTNVFIGYERGQHKFGFNLDNAFDKDYAIEVEKDTDGDRAWTPGAPRSFMLSYSYSFDK
jgi:iron complex outermembrane receptor protein